MSIYIMLGDFVFKILSQCCVYLQIFRNKLLIYESFLGLSRCRKISLVFSLRLEEVLLEYEET